MSWINKFRNPKCTPEQFEVIREDINEKLKNLEQRLQLDLKSIDQYLDHSMQAEGCFLITNIKNYLENIKPEQEDKDDN